MAKRKSKFSFKRLFYKAVLYFFAITIGLVLVFKFLPIPFTLTMAGEQLSALIDDKDHTLYYEWRSIEEISPELAIAVVASEDQLFPEHHGFDVKAIQSVLESAEDKKRMRGASTISQQVAKNVFLWQGRSWIRKGLETYYTVLIELIWGKKRILEVYMNVAEMGPMVFGAESASKRFLGKTAAKINRSNACRLAAVLPNPKKYNAHRPGPYIQKRTRAIERQVRALGGKSYLKDIGID